MRDGSFHFDCNCDRDCDYDCDCDWLQFLFFFPLLFDSVVLLVGSGFDGCLTDLRKSEDDRNRQDGRPSRPACLPQKSQNPGASQPIIARRGGLLSGLHVLSLAGSGCFCLSLAIQSFIRSSHSFLLRLHDCFTCTFRRASQVRHAAATFPLHFVCEAYWSVFLIENSGPPLISSFHYLGTP